MKTKATVEKSEVRHAAAAYGRSVVKPTLETLEKLYKSKSRRRRKVLAQAIAGLLVTFKEDLRLLHTTGTCKVHRLKIAG